jgi:hypothetical protein
MKKDAYYFPHFSNARSDRKILRVRKELGIEGYAIYFMLLETLREQTNLRYPLEDIDLLADDFGSSESKVRTVVCNYNLFDVDEEQNFFSIKQILYLQPYIERSARARLAANKRWKDIKQIECKSNANAMQMQCASNANKVKESKEKENKINNKKKAGVVEKPIWKESYENYLKYLREGFTKECKDSEFILSLELMNDSIDVIKTLQKAFREFWSTDEGYSRYKAKKSNAIDFKGLMRNIIRQEWNHVKKDNILPQNQKI